MNVARLFVSEGLPCGSSVTFAKALAEVTGLGATECMQLALRLFAGKYDVSHKLSVRVVNKTGLSNLASVCNEIGLSIEWFE